MRTFYGPVLATIHDRGFGDFARRAAPYLLRTLRDAGLRGGRVVDLGCGSGIWARCLVDAGYEVVGIDISAAMIRMARERVPEATFRRAAFGARELPPCVVVTALGECFNYDLGSRGGGTALPRLFRQIHRALCPGGLFIFDLLGPAAAAIEGRRERGREGEGWATRVSTESDPSRKRLVRTITSFSKMGSQSRRSREVHRLRLHAPAEVAGALRGLGFRIRLLGGYGRLRFRAGHTGYRARKP